MVAVRDSITKHWKEMNIHIVQANVWLQFMHNCVYITRKHESMVTANNRTLMSIVTARGNMYLCLNKYILLRIV
jgi:hypothetical protein